MSDWRFGARAWSLGRAPQLPLYCWDSNAGWVLSGRPVVRC